MAKDGLSDRCKRFELAEAGRSAMLGLPLLARLDGRAFHTFTRDLNRPLDATFKRAQVVELELPPVRQIANLTAVLFESAKAQAKS
jgi:hypothetical protein